MGRVGGGLLDVIVRERRDKEVTAFGTCEGSEEEEE